MKPNANRKKERARAEIRAIRSLLSDLANKLNAIEADTLPPICAYGEELWPSPLNPHYCDAEVKSGSRFCADHQPIVRWECCGLPLDVAKVGKRGCASCHGKKKPRRVIGADRG